MGDSPVLLGSPRDLDLLAFACTVANTDVRGVEPLGVDAQERGRALPVTDTTRLLAESTASVESAGGAEKATAVGPEALEPGAYGRM